MHGKHLRYALLTALLLALAFPGAAHAEQSPCMIPFNTPVGCIYAHLEPGTLTGDLDIISHTSGNGVSATGTLTITGINYSALNYSTDQSGMSFLYRFYNIQESGNPDFGTWYTYKEMTKTITVPAGGQVKDVSFKPAKSYIRGKIELTCDVKSFAGEDVACQVSIDGGTQASNIPAGQKASYILDPGAHSVLMTLVGANADLWAPASVTKSVTISASAAPKKVSVTFKKAGHLIANLDQPNAVGDWYLDGVQVGTQVASIQRWVAPNVSHKIEVKNLVDPTTEGVFKWRDASITATVSSGKEKTVTVKLKKEYLMGFLTIKCNIIGNPDPAFYSGTVDCQPTIDGQIYPIIPRGETVQYTLTPGQHQVAVINTLFVFFGSDPATLSQFFTPTVVAGKTVKVVYSFSFQ
jgi:hypothetical protein